MPEGMADIKPTLAAEQSCPHKQERQCDNTLFLKFSFSFGTYISVDVKYKATVFLKYRVEVDKQ